ncbi:MAG TPA: dTDP-4-dehydrorhamnose reductase, partial [Desulfohalobiaceae bacterium]|nr:dTDP-4-dehydrorhamnose reductase [Desulfohalobiaceae bacterium]
MRVVVPGASGQLGKEVVAQLQSLGETVIPLTRQEMDLNLKETISTCINDLSPDVVINCAAYTQVDQAESDPEAAYTVNQRSVRELALISRGIKAVFVHISTDFVFDGSKSCPYTEEDHPYPVNVYGASKLAGEKEVLDLCPQSLLLRTSWLYNHEGHNFVQTILRLAKEREIIRVVDDQIGSPTCVKDLAQVILTLLKNE